MNMLHKEESLGLSYTNVFCNSYASNLNGMRYVVWVSVRHQWNRPNSIFMTMDINTRC